MKSKNANYGVTKKFGYTFRLTDDSTAINDENEFENHYNENHLQKSGSNSRNFSYKRDSYSFNVVRLPHKSSAIKPVYSGHAI